MIKGFMLSKKLPGDSSELFPLWSESGDWPLASCVSVAAGLGFRLLWLLATAASLPAFLVAVAGAGCSLGASFLSAFVAGPGLGFSGFPELAALASGLFPLRTLPLESILGVLWAASGCAELSQLFSLAWLLQEAKEPPELKAWEQLFWDACHTGSVLPGHDTAAPLSSGRTSHTLGAGSCAERREGGRQRRGGNLGVSHNAPLQTA